MELRAVDCPTTGPARVAHVDDPLDDRTRWRWIDIRASSADTEELAAFAARFELDPLAVRDAIHDDDLPKVDDFGTSVVVVLHGLAEQGVETYEVDCFLTARVLVTVHRAPSPGIDALWQEIQHRAELTRGGVDELLARLADVLTRRIVSVLDAFDDRIEHLVTLALAADPAVIGEITAVRADLATVRRSVHPQRELLDLLRGSTSALVSDVARRRFSDVFDVASRAAYGIDAARTALTETLDAYRGAEARQATEVTKVLTVYAAIMLPLTLLVGFFGMNFPDLPGSGSDAAWIVVAVVMLVVTVISLGVFVSLGWVTRPSGRTAGSALGRGLVEGARAPVHLVGAALELSIMPLRTVASLGRRRDHRSGDDRPGAPGPG